MTKALLDIQCWHIGENLDIHIFLFELMFFSVNEFNSCEETFSNSQLEDAMCVYHQGVLSGDCDTDRVWRKALPPRFK